MFAARFYLRLLVRTLRHKLESDPHRPRIIGNELGIGYRPKLYANEIRKEADQA